MRITHWGEYGVQCSTYLAERTQQGAKVVGAAEIAKQQGIGLEYTQQILHRLRKGGVINSIRGPQGGYQLARESSDITLYDILVAAEGNSFEIICEKKPLNAQRCAPTSSCSLRPLWYDLRDHVNEFLLRFSLDDLLERRNTIETPVQIGENKEQTLDDNTACSGDMGGCCS